jgi:hypothetical protein
MRRLALAQASRTLTALLANLPQSTAKAARPAGLTGKVSPCDRDCLGTFFARNTAGCRSPEFAESYSTAAATQGKLQQFRLAQTGERCLQKLRSFCSSCTDQAQPGSVNLIQSSPRPHSVRGKGSHCSQGGIASTLCSIALLNTPAFLAGWGCQARASRNASSSSGLSRRATWLRSLAGSVRSRATRRQWRSPAPMQVHGT